MALCPNGHTSEWADYCSVCGAAISAPNGAATGAPAAAAPDAATVVAPIVLGDPCPVCGEPREVGAPFCEACGHDFTAPASSTPPAASVPTGAGTTPGTTLGWATIVADRSFFDRHADAGSLQFPDPPRAPLEVPLTREIVLIGRRSQSRGISPDVDLSGAADDPAASHRHAELRHTADGWTVTDLGSTNGTRLTADGALLTPGTPTRVSDAIYVGAWTVIRIGPPPAAS